jgi:hypothetical protein
MVSWPEEHDFDLPEAHPWDRRMNEPSKAYASFRVFRDLSPTHRDLGKVATEAGVTERSTERWANQWDWRGRADAWDDACHAVDDAERLDAIRSMHKTHRQAGRIAVLKAVQALNLLQADQMAEHPATIARLLELGAKLERSTLIVSVEELQGIEVEDEVTEDPWERIARELDPARAALD